MVSDAADIEESIRIILSTLPGERTMRPDFGCNIRKLVFEVADSRLTAELNHIIYHALLEYEPRIHFVSVTVIDHTGQEGVIYLQLTYGIIATNTRHNMVYPFYYLEGTNISSNE
ncbi:hypothetical protein MMC2321_02374 [Chitinophaga sp. MM2321]